MGDAADSVSLAILPLGDVLARRPRRLLGPTLSGGWGLGRSECPFLTPLTDQSGAQYRLHAAELFDWHPMTPAPTGTLGILAAELPVPEAVADAPVEKIIELRTRYASEFDRFTDLLSAAAAELHEELLQVSDPDILSGT
ncbi:hypothetical protein ABTY98_20875 [Streptomyces sp. NPDC096040]|uniref:hypothetical protein n=1 Tax=Streptomyces sp. NPDC096040 TaxID=3155541 RepID=UPI00333117C1